MRKLALATVFVGSLSSISLAQVIDIPLTNWTVPPYRAASSSGGYSTMVDISPGVGFVAMVPCRIVDTRGGAPFTGTNYGPPSMATGQTRTFDLNSAGHCQPIPEGVEAYSLNFTVTQTAGAGDVRAWPTGSPPPPGQETSVLNWTSANATLANGAIISAGGNGSIDVKMGGAGTHLLIDINGYFTDEYNFNIPFVVSGVFAPAAIRGINTSAGAAGVSGEGSAFGYGVVGKIASDNPDRAGVLGQTGFVGPDPGYSAAGVRGEGRIGVLGVSGHFLGGGDGVAGAIVDGFGAQITYGALGTSFGSDPSCVAGPCAAPWGVFSGGNIGAAGAKLFLDPHPSDPNLLIAYVSLEGPEAGTYFRGRGKFRNGIARIPVPEHFRFVTDPEGLTVQITPIGGMATFGVVRMDLNEIVVLCSRNLEFSYLVQGVRATFKDLSPYRIGGFMPRTADSKIPAWLSPAQKRLLIQNGTYSEDGVVNMETARRLGWDKVWEQRSRPTPQPEQP